MEWFLLSSAGPGCLGSVLLGVRFRDGVQRLGFRPRSHLLLLVFKLEIRKQRSYATLLRNPLRSLLKP